MSDIKQNFTYTLEGGSAMSSSVPADIQLFVSDMVYTLFYSSTSEIQTLLRSAQLTPAVAKSTIISVFADNKEKLYKVYPTIEIADMTVDEIYISKEVLYIRSTFDVRSITGEITEEINFSLPKR